MIPRFAGAGLPAVCCLCPSVKRYPWYLGTRNKKNIDTGHHDQPVSNHKWKSILVGHSGYLFLICKTQSYMKCGF